MMSRSPSLQLLSKDIDILNGAGKVERMRLLNILMQVFVFEGFFAGAHFQFSCENAAITRISLMALSQVHHIPPISI